MKIFVVAGEASGDLHGANLIDHLKTRSKIPLEIYGVGGDKIRRTGALEFFDLAHFHVTGITDAIKKIPEYKKAERIILMGIQKNRPQLVVLIDNPGFNLHLAQKIHALKIPIVYYIAPQIWAWGPKRIQKIKAYIQKVIVVFEFEKKIYEDRGVPVSWVGHPLKDLVQNVQETKKPGVLVSLMPGSRKGELKILFPIFMKAAKRMARKIPNLSFALIKAPTLPREYYERLIRRHAENIHCALVEEDSYSTIKASKLAIVCSGTATLECALLGTPMIISNKGTFLTYVAAKSFIRVPYLGLPNLILGKERFPELLQFDATPRKIADAAVKILTNESLKKSMREDLEEVSKKLGEPGANQRAAEEILKILQT